MIAPFIKNAKRRLILSAALAVPIFTMTGASTDIQNAKCSFATSNDGQIVETCVVKHAANNSWLHWLAGSSRSAHYQFIDLFELVYSHKDDNHQQAVIKTREG